MFAPVIASCERHLSSSNADHLKRCLHSATDVIVHKQLVESRSGRSVWPWTVSANEEGLAAYYLVSRVLHDPKGSKESRIELLGVLGRICAGGRVSEASQPLLSRLLDRLKQGEPDVDVQVSFGKVLLSQCATDRKALWDLMLASARNQGTPVSIRAIQSVLQFAMDGIETYDNIRAYEDRKPRRAWFTLYEDHVNDLLAEDTPLSKEIAKTARRSVLSREEFEGRLIVDNASSSTMDIELNGTRMGQVTATSRIDLRRRLPGTLHIRVLKDGQVIEEATGVFLGGTLVYNVLRCATYRLVYFGYGDAKPSAPEEIPEKRFVRAGQYHFDDEMPDRVETYGPLGSPRGQHRSKLVRRSTILSPECR